MAAVAAAVAVRRPRHQLGCFGAAAEHGCVADRTERKLAGGSADQYERTAGVAHVESDRYERVGTEEIFRACIASAESGAPDTDRRAYAGRARAESRSRRSTAFESRGCDRTARSSPAPPRSGYRNRKAH